MNTNNITHQITGAIFGHAAGPKVMGVSPSQLNSLLTGPQGQGVLLIDCQDQYGPYGGGQGSRINHANCIAIPASALHYQHDGKKADKSIGKHLKQTGRDYEHKLWKERSRFHTIILYDQASTWNNRSHNLNAVIHTMSQNKEKKDKKKKHHNYASTMMSVQVLDGGIQSLYQGFPHLITGSQTQYGQPPMQYSQPVQYGQQVQYNQSVQYGPPGTSQPVQYGPPGSSPVYYKEGNKGKPHYVDSSQVHYKDGNKGTPLYVDSSQVHYKGDHKPAYNPTPVQYPPPVQPAYYANAPPHGAVPPPHPNQQLGWIMPPPGNPHGMQPPPYFEPRK